MIWHRDNTSRPWAWAAVGLVTALASLPWARLAAQRPVPATGLFEDARRPDYLAELALKPKPQIALPPPPLDWTAVEEHSYPRPDYLNEIVTRRVSALPQLPPPPLGQPPAVVRGLYLNAWVFGSSRFWDLLRLADSTEVNTFVIDVKDDTGYLTYRSNVPTAADIGANGRIRAPDVRERLSALRSRGIHPVARIVVAKDPLLARGKVDWAIHDVRGGLWHDRQGNAWVDAYQDSVWIYAAQLAEEAVLMGFGEVQFDYVRFPDEPTRLLRNTVYPAKLPDDNERRGVRRHLALLRDRIEPLGVPFTIDVFGLTTSAETDMGIGQVWEDLVNVADVVLPMVYPSHYQHGSYGFARPNAEPYAVVRRALHDGLERSRALPRAARIRPYLQAFTLGRPRYTAAEVRAQIAAVEDLGLSDWVLWNARGVYPADALRPGPVGRAANSFGDDPQQPGTPRPD